MSRLFHVGDLVVTCNARYFTEYDGVPAIVVGALAPRRARDLATMEVVTVPCYRVELLVEPALIVLADPHQLRPLRDDPDRALSIKDLAPCRVDEA